jgi:DNA polymerase-3 subunit epsilon
MNLLIIDIETTGFDPKKDKVIEVGAILFNCETHTVLEQLSFLIPCDSNDAFHVNRINPEASFQSTAYTHAIEHLQLLANISDWATAYNAKFDKQWFGHPNQELPVLMHSETIELPWFDAMDIKWPRASKKTQNLVGLALDHAIPVTSAHRALTDCHLLAELFRRCKDVAALISGAMEPKALMIAQVSFEEKDLAKEQGFIWSKIVPKKWAKYAPESEIEEFSFPVEVVREDIPNAA